MTDLRHVHVTRVLERALKDIRDLSELTGASWSLNLWDGKVSIDIDEHGCSEQLAAIDVPLDLINPGPVRFVPVPDAPVPGVRYFRRGDRVLRVIDGGRLSPLRLA